MPTVPRAKVQITPTGYDIAVANPTAPLESFGGGQSLAQAGAATRSTLSAAANIALKEKQKADDAAVDSRWNDLVRQKNDMLYNPKTGALTRKGESAFGVVEEFSPKFKQTASDIEESLYNDDQKAMFTRRRLKEETEFDAGLQRHVFQEADAFEKAQFATTLETLSHEAALNYTNPRKIDESIALQSAKIDSREDWSPEEKDLIKSKAESAIHSDIIETYLANSDATGARAYYNENKAMIVGEEAKKFPNYIDAYEKKIEAQIKAEKEKQYDKNFRESMLDMFDGNMTMSENQRKFRLDLIKDSDYNLLEKKIASPDYMFLREFSFSDPVIYNGIREAQLSGSMTPGEIDRLIAQGNVDGKIVNEDAKFLTKINEGLPPSPKDKRLKANASTLRNFGLRYISTGLLDRAFGEGLSEEGRDNEVEGLVSEYIRRVDKERAEGDRLDEIARDVTRDYIAKEYPEIAKEEDIPNIVVGIDGKVRRLLEPGQKSKIKPSFKITPVNVSPAAPSKSDKGKK